MMNTRNILPAHWESKKLGQVCTKITKGGTPTTYGFAFVQKGINFIKIENIEQGKVDLKSIRTFITKEAHKYQNKSILEENDLLFSIAGTIGETCLIKKEYLPANTNQALAILRGYSSEVLPKFLTYQLNSSITEYVKSKARGGAMNNISLEDLKQIDLVIPPISEQLSLVSKIEELFSELDQGIESLRLAQQQLKVYRQSVLKWAFEGRMTNEDVKEGELPKGWKMTELTSLVKKEKHSLKAGPFGSSLKKEFYVAKGYKIYGQEQVISGNPFLGDYYIDAAKYRELESCKVKPNDILISLVGTVGKVLLLPTNCKEGIINPRLIKVSLDTDVYLPAFFKYYFESSSIKSFYSAEAKGTTMDVLNLGIIKTIPFPLCTIEEQRAIVEEVESRLSLIDKMEESINQSLLQSEALRQSILKRAFEGCF